MSLWQHTEKMSVVFLSETGHTVGAATHLGNLDAEYPTSALVGERMPLMWPLGMLGSQADLLRALQIDASELSVASVDFDDRIFRKPLGFRVLGDADDPVLTEESNRTLASPLYSEVDRKITISRPGTPPSSLKEQSFPYFVVYQNASVRKVFAGQWTYETNPPANFVIEGVSLDFDSYAVFMAIKGFALFYDKVDVTP